MSKECTKKQKVIATHVIGQRGSSCGDSFGKVFVDLGLILPLSCSTDNKDGKPG